MNITNDIITAYLDSLYCCKNEDLARLREFAEERIIPIILKDTEDLLRVLLKIYQPKRILEIGTAIGYSACFFRIVCDCRVTTIESSDEMVQAAHTNIDQLGFADSIDVIHGEALDVLESLQKSILDDVDSEDKKFDFVFVDAAKSHYLEFWELFLPMCKDNALIVCDNVLMRGTTASDIYDPKNKHRTSIRHMREFLTEITHMEGVETTVLAVGDGVSISLLTGNE